MFTQNLLPYPDKILFLDLPKEFIPKAMISERKGSERNYLEGAEDIHEADDTFQQKVYEEYTYLANTMKNFTKIKCYSNKAILSIQDIHALICHELK